MADNSLDIQINALLNTNDAIKEANKAGEKIKDALSVQSDDAAIQAWQKSLQDIYKTVEDIKTKIKETAIDTHKIALSEAEVTEQKKLQADQVKLLAEHEAQLKQAHSEFTGPEGRLTKLQNKNKLYSTGWGETARREYANLQATIDATNAKLATTNARLLEIEAHQLPKNIDFSSVTTEIKDYVTEMLKCSSIADQIIDRQENLANSTEQTAATQASSMDEVTNAMEQVQSATDAYKTSVEEASNVEVNINGFTEQTAANAESASQNMGEVAQAVQQLGQNSTEAENDVSRLLHRIAELKENIAKIESGQPIGADNHKATIEEYQRMNVELRESQKLLKIYRGQMDAVSNSTGKGGKDTRSITMAMRDLKSVANGVVKTFKQFNVLGKIGDRLKSSVNSINKNLDSTLRSLRSSLKHGFTRFTKYILGFKSLYFLVRRLRKFVVEGIENLVQYNDKLSKGVKSHNLMNDAMNDLQTSLLYLKNAWAAAFAPIVIKVMPILTGFIDYLAVAGNAIAKFVAELTGQATAYNALKVQAQDYADSLDDAGKSAKKTANDQDKLNQSLADYDKLLVIKSKNDDDANGTPSGGSGASAYSPKVQDMFTTILADENSFASALGEALKKANLEQAGEMIGQAIKNGLDNIQWGEIQNKVGEVTTRVGTFLKGIFNTEGLMSTVGKSAGEVVNTISVFVTNILNQTKDIDFGGGLATALNAFVDATDWNSIKSNIKETIRQLKENFKNLINGIEWSTVQFELGGLGEALGDALASAASDTSFMQSIGTGFAETINTIVAVIKGFFDGTKGKDVGGGIATALNTAMQKINFKQIAQTISDGLIFVLSNASSFFEQVDWDNFGTAVQDFLENIDWGTVFSEVARFVVSSNNGLTKLLASISNAVSDTILNAEPKDISDAIQKFVEGIDWVGIADAVGSLFAASMKALVATPVLIVKVFGGLFGAMIAGIKDYFVKVAEEYGLDKDKDIGMVIVLGICEAVMRVIQGEEAWGRKYFAEPLINNFLDSLLGKEETFKDSKGTYKKRVGGIIENIIGSDRGSFVSQLTKGFEGLDKKLGKAIGDPVGTALDIIFGEEQTYKDSKGTYKKRAGGILDKIADYFDPKKNAAAFNKIADKIKSEDGILKGLKEVFSGNALKNAIFGKYEKGKGWVQKGLMSYFSLDKNEKDSVINKIKAKLEDENGILGALRKLFTGGVLKEILFGKYEGKKLVRSGLLQLFDVSGDQSIISAIKKKLESNDGIIGSIKKIFSPDTIYNMIFKQGHYNKKQTSGLSWYEMLFGYKYGVSGAREKGVIEKIIDGIVDAFGKIKTGLKAPFQAIIDFFYKNFINKIVDAINWLQGKLTFTIGGKSYTIGGLNHINYPAIPKLAQGAVIPPNKEFLAVLGDQKQGTNIETPLNTMVDAFKIALAEGGGNTNHAPIVLQLDGRTVAQVVWDEEAKKYKQTGFGLAY